MGAGESECQISQKDILHVKYSEFYLCFHNKLILLKFDIRFLGLLWMKPGLPSLKEISKINWNSQSDTLKIGTK